MKYIALITLLFAFSATRAQKNITLTELNDHIGDSITVTGKVYGIKYFENAKESPTLINIGAAYPNQLLTVVIYGDDRKKLSIVPEKAFSDKELSISGKVELFKGKPQIVIHSENQIKAISL